MIKGAIFDVDGTLLDSMPMWGCLTSEFVRSLGKVPEEGLDQKLYEYSFDEGVSYVKTAYGLKEEESQLKAGILQMVRKAYEEELEAKEGVPELLEELSKHKVPMVIATSSDKELVAAAMKRLGLLTYFQEIFTCDDLKTSKKDSFIYHHAADCMGTSPEETWVFEDALYAVRSAQKGGFHVVGVYDVSSEEYQEMIRNEADDYVRSLKDFASGL